MMMISAECDHGRFCMGHQGVVEVGEEGDVLTYFVVNIHSGPFKVEPAHHFIH